MWGVGIRLESREGEKIGEQGRIESRERKRLSMKGGIDWKVGSRS